MPTCWCRARTGRYVRAREAGFPGRDRRLCRRCCKVKWRRPAAEGPRSAWSLATPRQVCPPERDEALARLRHADELEPRAPAPAERQSESRILGRVGSTAPCPIHSRRSLVFFAAKTRPRRWASTSSPPAVQRLTASG